MTYFSKIPKIQYEGPSSKNPLSYRYYDAKRSVLGKSMEEHLRIAVCAWHTFCWQGEDNFGAATFERAWLKSNDPMTRAKHKMDASIEFIHKLGVPFFTFHDRDIAPEGENLSQSIDYLNQIGDHMQPLLKETGIKILWGTANLFSHPRYLAGAATNPDPKVFAYACAQVKAALDLTHRLGGENYVLWGGREGYDSLLNTDLSHETRQYAEFLGLLVNYKKKIGFEGALLIEPKPCEPTKHQYDFDCGHVLAFLERFGLANEYQVNIEANHATLAGHSFEHEVLYACANRIFGSIDANRGDAQLGWDTDQFPIDLSEISRVIYHIIKHGGFRTGGFNFDTKLRRQSIALEDMFYAHISGIDTLARGLLIAEKMLENDDSQKFIDERYAGWQQELGQRIMRGDWDFATLAKEAVTQNFDPKPKSGHQEQLESWLNGCI